MNKWKLLSSKQLVNSQYLRVYENSYELPNKEIIPEFYLTERKDAALCVCRIENKFLLVQQYRPGIQEVTFCHPGGGIEKADDSPVSGALRELLEETGCKPDKVISLGSFAQIPAASSATIHMYLVTCTKHNMSSRKLDQTEDLNTIFIDINKIEKLINDGLMNCSACVAATYRALAYLTAT